jgi:hypothetical protein
MARAQIDPLFSPTHPLAVDTFSTLSTTASQYPQTSGHPPSTPSDIDTSQLALPNATAVAACPLPLATTPLPQHTHFIQVVRAHTPGNPNPTPRPEVRIYRRTRKVSINHHRRAIEPASAPHTNTAFATTPIRAVAVACLYRATAALLN